MRSSAWLLGGMVLVGAGVAVVVAGVPGRWVIGPVLVVAGLAAKVAGLAVDPSGDRPRSAERRATTLGGAGGGRSGAGASAGRAPLRTRGPAPGRRSAPAPSTAWSQRRAS